MSFQRRLSILSLAFSALAATPAVPQVPPHVPGQICYTPSFWCWANPAGLPGDPCVCIDPQSNRAVQGTLN
ncbi:hypothetical protein [Tropicimonas sp.]|uniref:hypothetical protein n=1 Tax=Tropicimonas sp. TaxID=2067044 RepID=UPI003A8602E0